jgi:cysteine desulfurase / selenocysteine lyase
MTSLNPIEIRKDFPILHQEVHPGKTLVYLDSTATTQKPVSVLESMDDYYRKSNANIHRGVYTIAEKATALYEGAREKVANFIGARKSREVIFTRNATESINLVAYSWGRANLNQGDLVILSEMEHHANLVPWQMLAAEKGIRLEFIPVTDDGLLDLDQYPRLLGLSPKLVAFTHMSNVLGTITPAKEITKAAHDAGALVLIDGAQSVPHFPVNIREIDADFLVFSAHKMCGPTGVGVLYGRESILDVMPPFQGGGDMIKKVHLRSFVPNDLPHKFEAGTPAIAEVIGLGAAIDYLNQFGMDAIQKYEHEIINYALRKLSAVPGVEVYGPDAQHKGAVASFSLFGVHPHDVAQILDSEGIAVRAGHHCAMPLHERFHLDATTRASFYIYNTLDEVDKLVECLEKVKKVFRV